MKTKTPAQYFLFPDGTVQQLPNSTHDMDAVIVDVLPDIDILPSTQSERAWRNAELVKVDRIINQLEDETLNASAWRAYRISLRHYPEQADFPQGERPTRPKE
ncbi:phage tail assembly chaperone [Enterovibrio coralii]|uniref:Phage tail assembly chaperone-like domain-containing protein n=1 Tax=Enterovibrio coralii TaxID=294935 RepID=A0A135I6X2_9GAMM|nr:phage tail assembly chaperone [Enterovibrio coralii]KXF81195.1 hypothetical protein ATN88_00020 [Enterovibrio coralii]